MILRCNKCGRVVTTPVDHRGATCNFPVKSKNTLPDSIGGMSCRGRFFEIDGEGKVVTPVETARDFIGQAPVPVEENGEVAVTIEQRIANLERWAADLRESMRILRERVGFAGAAPTPKLSKVAQYDPYEITEPLEIKTMADYCVHATPSKTYSIFDHKKARNIDYCADCEKPIAPESEA